jgi:acyl carrier protein
MIREEGLRLLEGIVDLPPQTLDGTEKLEDLDGWDSLSTLNFIAAVDGKFGVPLPGNRVIACRTVADLLGLLGEHVVRRSA